MQSLKIYLFEFILNFFNNMVIIIPSPYRFYELLKLLLWCYLLSILSPFFLSFFQTFSFIFDSVLSVHFLRSIWCSLTMCQSHAVHRPSWTLYLCFTLMTAQMSSSRNTETWLSGHVVAINGQAALYFTYVVLLKKYNIDLDRLEVWCTVLCIY